MAAMELERREREDRWRADPWSWVQDRVNLLDPLAGTGTQVAPFPDFPYLRALFTEFANNNALVVWKSRRMIASWSALVYAVWLCLMFPNTRVLLISRKEGETDGEGARELVWRCKWILQNLRGQDRWGRADVDLAQTGKLFIGFVNGSTITGISSDPNAARGVSANLVIGDEFAFWDRPRDSYAAIKPTLEARGKFIGLSSSAEGFFKEIVRDTVEEGGGAGRGIIAIPGQGVLMGPATEHDAVDEDAQGPGTARPNAPPTIPGFAAWTNRFNRFRIVAMHYSADPRKRSAEWKQREQEGVPLSIWLREYEMQFDVRSGRPVYLHEWRPQTMLQERIKTERSRPIIVGVDFGYHHPAMVAAQMRYGHQLCVLRALQGSQVRFEDFMIECLTQLQQWFPNRNVNDPNEFLWCCDASGIQEQGTGAPEVKIMRHQFGLKPKFKKVKIPPTIDVVRGFMSRTYRGESCFLVDNNITTQLLVDGLNGGYAYPEGEIDEATTPDKDNIHDHLQDCVRYICVNFGGEPQRALNRAAIQHAAVSDIIHPAQYI